MAMGNGSIQFLRGSSTAIASNSTQVPAAGQPVYDLTNKRLFIGDGTTALGSLTPLGTAGPTGATGSTGAVGPTGATGTVSATVKYLHNVRCTGTTAASAYISWNIYCKLESSSNVGPTSLSSFYSLLYNNGRMTLNYAMPVSGAVCIQDSSVTNGVYNIVAIYAASSSTMTILYTYPSNVNNGYTLNSCEIGTSVYGSSVIASNYITFYA